MSSLEGVNQKQLSQRDQSSMHILVDVMQHYMDFTSVDTMINHQYINDLNILDVLNSYLHLTETCDTYHRFEEIVNKFNVCDFSTCNAFRRNHRNRSKLAHEHKPKYKQVSLQILDKIHCYFCHSYDIGHRLSIKERMMLDSDNDNDIDTDQHVLSEQLINHRTLNINRLLCEKRKRYHEVYNDLNINKRMNAKYNQLTESTNMEQKDEHISHPNSDKIFRFGYKFEYDHNEPIDNDKSTICVTAKYSNFKEELITNNIRILTIAQYNNEYSKAQIHFKSRYNKTKYKDKLGGYICLPLDFILALMIYCNFDELQYHFSKTYREENGRKHDNFYYLAKYITVSVSKCGSGIGDENVAVFYHGMSEKFVFPSYIGDEASGVLINGPLSTSSSFAVATNFTNSNQGLIIQFGGNWTINNLSVAWLSDFGSESEYLFVQNFHGLQIVDIVDPYLGINYEILLKALLLMDKMTSGEYAQLEDGIYTGDPDQISDNKMQSFITDIISHQLSYTQTKYKSLDSLSTYAKIICNVYCRNKREIFMYSPRSANLPFMYEYLFHSDCDWMDLFIVNALFPNVQKVTLQNVQLNGLIMDHILAYLKKRSNDSKLKQILIFTKEQNIQTFIDEYAQTLRPHNGYLYGTTLSTNILYLEICTELAFVLTLINRMHHGIYYKNSNHKVFNLMNALIKTRLEDTNNISADHKQQLFNDYCVEKSTIDIDWKQLRSIPHCYFCKLFCDAKYEWKQLEIIIQIFPNIEELRLMNMNLSASVLENMLKHLTANQTKIKFICMALIPNSALSSSSAVNMYRNAFKTLNFNLYDDNGYISDSNQANGYEHEQQNTDDIFDDILDSDHVDENAISSVDEDQCTETESSNAYQSLYVERIVI